MRVMVLPGETMLGALQRGKVNIEAPCGGNGTCGRCEVMIYGIGCVKACQFRKPGMYEVTVPKQASFDAVAAAELLEKEEVLPDTSVLSSSAAVDLGTTTVVVHSWNKDGEQKEIHFTNPQRKYGADVMSRIRAEEEGLGKELQHLIAKPLAEAAGDSEVIVVAANTTMEHLLEGLSCEGLGKAPFHPKKLDFREVNGVEIGMNKKNTVLFLPGISAFVGADIVSGIYALGMSDTDKVSFLVDLGTNGEMALGNRNRLLVASASAGPAFEGSELAQYIYGSGIMRTLRQMLEDGAMDETGLLCDRYFESGYPVQAKGKQLFMTQDTIRAIQMAKAAIRAGIDILLKEYGITEDQVETVYLAGGMGYYLNPSDAIAIGLLPKEWKGRIQAVGNTSLRGAKAYLKNPGIARAKMDEIAGAAEEIVLATHPMFEQSYIDGMNF